MRFSKERKRTQCHTSKNQMEGAQTSLKSLTEVGLFHVCNLFYIIKIKCIISKYIRFDTIRIFDWPRTIFGMNKFNSYR